MKKLTFLSIFFLTALCNCEPYNSQDMTAADVCDYQLVQEWTGQYSSKADYDQIHVDLTEEGKLKVQWLIEHNFTLLQKCDSNPKLQVWQAGAVDRTSDDPAATKGKVN